MSARDLRYGRQGGRWTDADPSTLLAEIDKLRERTRQKDRDAPLPDGAKRWPDPVDHAPTPPADDAAWEDRARMADARRHAGAPLDPTDSEALHRHPQPRTALGAA